jgi:hypothetical protein
MQASLRHTVAQGTRIRGDFRDHPLVRQLLKAHRFTYRPWQGGYWLMRGSEGCTLDEAYGLTLVQQLRQVGVDMTLATIDNVVGHVALPTLPEVLTTSGHGTDGHYRLRPVAS